MDMQRALDQAYRTLMERHPEERVIWDLNIVRRWGSAPASEKQLNLIRRRCRGFEPEGLTKMQASMILGRVLGGKAS